MKTRTLVLVGFAAGIVGGLTAVGFAFWLRGFKSEWIGFAGSVISGLMTIAAALIAGAVAWPQVQHARLMSDLAVRGYRLNQVARVDREIKLLDVLDARLQVSRNEVGDATLAVTTEQRDNWRLATTKFIIELGEMSTQLQEFQGNELGIPEIATLRLKVMIGVQTVSRNANSLTTSVQFAELHHNNRTAGMAAGAPVADIGEAERTAIRRLPETQQAFKASIFDTSESILRLKLLLTIYRQDAMNGIGAATLPAVP